MHRSHSPRYAVLQVRAVSLELKVSFQSVDGSVLHVRPCSTYWWLWMSCRSSVVPILLHTGTASHGHKPREAQSQDRFRMSANNIETFQQLWNGVQETHLISRGLRFSTGCGTFAQNEWKINCDVALELQGICVHLLDLKNMDTISNKIWFPKTLGSSDLTTFANSCPYDLNGIKNSVCSWHALFFPKLVAGILQHVQGTWQSSHLI